MSIVSCEGDLYCEPPEVTEYNEITQLKPCPFCGAIPDIKRLHLSNHKISFSIVCFNTNCFVKPMSEWFNTEEEAIEAWNRRADDD